MCLMCLCLLFQYKPLVGSELAGGFCGLCAAVIWAGEELLLGGGRNSTVTELQQHPEITFGAVGAPNLRVKLAALIIVQSKRCCTLG